MAVINPGQTGLEPRVVYQPNEQAQEQQVAAKDPAELSNIRSVTVTGDEFKVVTDKGVLTFNSPQLQKPESHGSTAELSAANNNFALLTSDKKALTDLAEVMVLFHELGQQMRNSAKEIRQSERDAAFQTILQQADEMRKAADDRYSAAMWSAFGQIVGGAISMRGAVKGIQAGPDMSQAVSMHYQGLGQIMEGLFSMASAGSEFNAAMHDAAGKELEGKKTIHDNAAQDQDDWYRRMGDFMAEVRQLLEATLKAKQETENQLTRV